MANALALKLGFMSKEEEKRVENLLKKYDIPQQTLKFVNLKSL